MPRANRGKPPLDRLRQRGIIPAHGFACALQCRAERRRQCHVRRHDRQSVAIDPRRVAHLAPILDQGAFLQERRKVAGFERERPLDRLHLSLRQAQRVQARGQVGPQRRMVRVGHGSALEQLPSLVGLPALHHAQAQLVQHRRMRGCELRQAREKLIGFAAAAGGECSLGRLDHPQDSGGVRRHGIDVVQKFPTVSGLRARILARAATYESAGMRTG